MTIFDRVTGIVVATAVTLCLTWLSFAPVRGDAAGGALLRLTWRARPERIENCRQQNAETLAALPPHMRQSVICEGANASYLLQVRRDDVVVVEQLVTPGGLRKDRPLYVFRDIPLPAGDAEVRVAFVRVEPTVEPTDDANGTSGEDGGGAETEAAARRREELTEAVPRSLVYEQRLRFAPGQVRLISYDPERRELFEVAPTAR